MTSGGSATLIDLLPEHRSSVSRSNDPMACSSTACSLPGSRCSPIHPNQVKAARERFRRRGASRTVRRVRALPSSPAPITTASACLAPDGDETEALRALSRARARISSPSAWSRSPTSLRSATRRFWPGAARIFSDLDLPITLAFLERYPSPADARGLGPKRLRHSSRHQYCGRTQPRATCSTDSEAPPRPAAGEPSSKPARQVVLSLVAALQPLVDRSACCQPDRRRRARPPRRLIFLSLFRDPKRASPPPHWSPKSATTAPATPTPTRSPPTPA